MARKRTKKSKNLPSERQKIVEEVEDDTMRITDLDEYCLEHIFGYLDLKDLVNVGLSNTVFQHAAGIVFKRKSGGKVEIVSFEDLICTIGNSELDKIQSKNLIPTFGGYISNITVLFNPRAMKLKNYKEIFHQISKYLVESLVKITLDEFPRGWLNRFSNPFPKVESVQLFGCNLRNDKLVLSDIFPNLNHLNINRGEFVKNNLIVTHLPCLKKLELFNEYDAKCPVFQSLLDLNPQLESCTYTSYGGYEIPRNFRFVKFVAEQSKLEKFGLLSSIHTDEHFHFKNVKRFHYSARSLPNNFPFSFDQLEKLKLDFIEEKLIDDIIKQNEKLVKLSLRANQNIFYHLTEELAKLQLVSLSVIRTGYWKKKHIDLLAKFLNEKSSATNVKLKHFCSMPLGEYLESKIDNSKWELKHIQKYCDDYKMISHVTYVTKVKN